MPEIKKILYATDLSPNSASLVFSYAIDMAKKYGATIVMLHAVEPVHIVAYAGSTVAGMMKGAQKQEQETGLEEIKKRIQAFCEEKEAELGFPCQQLIEKILVPLGNPVHEILRVTDEEGCDAIVLGTHQKGFLTQAFLGSVTREILERTCKPVFVVPMPSEKK